MKKPILFVLLIFFPFLVFPDSSTLSFSPPATDYSVVFLGNLFGSVDGVLHSSGSQIMGAIFGVFNSAVLALGGIIIMYTLMVSTMNTAHEGQMLGQKWSSIWIPLRSTLGLGLLIPKASGYCLMQIFIMWVVTQGVGAADKVWAAALSYLNRGGVIVQTQPNPGIALLQAATTDNPMAKAAYTILIGQVCMLGIQKQLEMQRTKDLQSSGRCAISESKASAGPLCDGAVPDFLSTVNFVDIQQASAADDGVYSVNMPDFSHSKSGATDGYKAIDGVCGVVKWKAVSLPDQPKYNISLSDSEKQTAELSRAIALQQMFIDLSTVAQSMVSNDPQLNPKSSSGSEDNTKNEADWAYEQFGIPLTQAGVVCPSYNQYCTSWGADPAGAKNGVLLNGTEFTGSIVDYNGVMKPTLNLINEMNSDSSGQNSRNFITTANSQGWMMAGAYFFDLVRLNGGANDDATQNSSLDDSKNSTGMDTSTPVVPSDITPGASSSKPTVATAYTWIASKSAPQQLQNLLNGDLSSGQEPNLKATTSLNIIQSGGTQNYNASTVWGYVNNSMMVQQPGQPGLNRLSFANVIHFQVSSTMYYLPYHSFSCGSVKTFQFSFCLGSILADIFYNGIIFTVYNALVFFFQQIVQQIIMAFIMIPIDGIAYIFQDGVKTISTPGINPIIALANMGIEYINFSANLWMGLMALAIMGMSMPLLGVFMFAVLSFVMPLLFAWIGVMTSIGFSTAYYIPILPYMIFTFGAVAWLIAVIEAMVAGPIVALGVTHPEGHDAFGKGEAAIMLLMNVFLRPAMMIIGYIAGISLSYVSVWVLNAGFDHAIGFIQQGGSEKYGVSGSGGYDDWAGIYAFFFSVLLYTTMYITLVQKAFTLISYLPDKVLRWIGGNPESLGAESSQWGDELVKGKSGEAATQTSQAQAQMGKQAGAKGQELAQGLKSMLSNQGSSGGKASAKGSTPNAPE